MSDSEAEQHKLYWALLAKVWVFPGVFIDPVLGHLLLANVGSAIVGVQASRPVRTGTHRTACPLHHSYPLLAYHSLQLLCLFTSLLVHCLPNLKRR